MPGTSSDTLGYTRLMSSAPEDGLEDESGLKAPATTHSLRSRMLVSVLMTLLAIYAAAAFHLSVLSDSPLLFRPREIEARLRMALPSPNLDKGRDIMDKKNYKSPWMLFPGSMTRVNAAEPDMIYYSGASVVLSPTDSMIYHWRLNSTWPMCYITAWVSAAEDLIAAHKSYSSEGNVTAIEIWNLTSPDDSKTLKSMSWNTRPARVSLLGTVNFTSVKTQRGVEDLIGQELRAPTPRFGCLGDTKITVEVACTACRLEFDQIFSTPALGFELMQLG
ncbi:hypothetical protein GGX14DRAFT_561805 [Mycena pura]|uniref:Ubiquitin 3 binding protein But2 C-terminal domain-containing protein n=1 Tax=Mycena pura TaxID=153505 RepID=A0AAD6VV18_9AGAR|nr:hypothetical protein GGX14DRAFT_561805 [Mycena pura]